VGTVTSVAALTLGTSGTDLSSTVANSTSTPVITLNVPTASATNRGALSSADFTTFNNKQATISVTAPVVLTGATISMPAATTSVNGYLTSTDWNTFNNKSNTNGTVTSVVALTIGTTGIDITSTAVTTTTTPVITLNIPTASASNRGALSSTDWTTFNNKQATLSLTTTGTSGAATLVANTLNIPNYGSALSGYLPLTGGTLTGALGGTSATFSSTVISNVSTNALNIGNSQNSTIALSTFGKTSTSGYATANNYLQIGSGENATSSTRLIGFGYSITANTNQPAYIGYIETSNTGETKGSLIFGTRDVTTDTAPTTRLTIASTGVASFTNSNLKVGTLASSGNSGIEGGIASTSSLATVLNSLTLSNYNASSTGHIKIELSDFDKSSAYITYSPTLTAATNLLGLYVGSIGTGLQINGSGVGTFSIASGIYTAVDIKSPNTSVYYKLTPTGGDSYILGSGVAQTDDFCILNSTRSTNYLKFIGGASGGAATFSSSVTATTQGTNSSFNTGAFIAKSNGNAFRYTQIGYDNTSNYGWIQALEQGTAYTNLILNGAGGNLGLGTTTPDVTGFGWTTLTIKGGTSGGSAGVIELQTPTTTANGQNIGLLAFLDNTTRNAQIGVQRATSTSTADMMFYTNAGAGIIERLRITSLGKLSVANTLPGDDTINFANLSATGYGMSVIGGSGSLYSFTARNYVSTPLFTVLGSGVINAASRANFLGATDNALFSLNSGGTLYTVGFSPTATASSTNTLTLTTGTTTWIYTGTGTATWTLPNPSGNNQIYWIKNAGTGIITLNAYSGTNIINNAAASVSSITIAVGSTAVIAQDGNVKSYQLQ